MCKKEWRRAPEPGGGLSLGQGRGGVGAGESVDLVAQS